MWTTWLFSNVTTYFTIEQKEGTVEVYALLHEQGNHWAHLIWVFKMFLYVNWLGYQMRIEGEENNVQDVWVFLIVNEVVTIESNHMVLIDHLS